MKSFNSLNDPLDIIIIGGGWSGLYAAKYAKAEGLTCKILESRENLGGVWNFSNNKEIITVMKDTISTSSRLVTEASDFPMPKSMGNFLLHQEVLVYLKEYAKKFDLTNDIILNSKVLSTSKINDSTWEVKTSDTTYYTRQLVVCAGIHQQKREITGPVNDFGGVIYHSGDFKHFDDFNPSENDHVVVYGGGETASDIIDALVWKKCKITWAIKGGQHFFRKTTIRRDLKRATVDRFDTALDERTTPLVQTFINFNKNKSGMRWMCNKSNSGSVFSYQGHGVQEWANDIPWFRAFLNKNGHSVEHVWFNRVTPAPGIKRCEGARITFENDKTIEATHVICCFGYKHNFNFLPSENKNDPIHLNYKLIFSTKDPSLSFIGYARPTIISLPFMAELQCLFASKVWAGKIRLPTKETMQEIALKEYLEREEFFHFDYSNKNLVSPSMYIKDMLECSTNNKLVKVIVKNFFSDWNNLRLIPSLISMPLWCGLIINFINKSSLSLEDRQRIKDSSIYIKKHNPFYKIYKAFVTLAIPRLLRLDDLFDWIAKRKLKKYGRSVFYEKNK